MPRPLLPSKCRWVCLLCRANIAAAIVGGTISAFTGGKFANGAITAAYGQAFNGNSFWDKAKELGSFAVAVGKEFVPGIALAGCVNNGCDYFSWAMAVGEVAVTITGVGGAGVLAYKMFKSGRNIDRIREVLTPAKGGILRNTKALLLQNSRSLKQGRGVRLGVAGEKTGLLGKARIEGLYKQGGKDNGITLFQLRSKGGQRILRIEKGVVKMGVLHFGTNIAAQALSIIVQYFLGIKGGINYEF